jgi:hypothetical protein
MHSLTRAARAIAPRPPHAFTLIEMLVSLTITLLMMGSVVALFGIMADSVSGSRAALEMSDRLRGCRNRIQLDLQGATATMNPPLRPENDEGYFELIEGPFFDSTAVNPTNPAILNNGFSATANLAAGSLFGDTDDALLFTVRSRGEPFVGKTPTGTIESQVAEVAYFLRQDGPVIDATAATPIQLCTLYRRVMLVVPNSGLVLTGTLPAFYDSNDISVHMESTTPVANTLGDLTKPENRFARITATFPYRFNTATVGFTSLGGRLGDDVLMTNVLAFDVQVWDPGAPIYLTTGTPAVSVEPRDQGYIVPGSPTIFGAYVDLGYAQSGYAPANPPFPLFNLAPSLKSGYTVVTPRLPFVYDTWSLHYENDGILQKGTLADQGTNGLDDDGLNGVDDIGEFDTLPPYSAPLRGIRVVVRAYEPSSQQVRQVTIIQDFMPE